MSVNLLRKIWNRVLNDAVYDEQGRIMVYSIHCVYHNGDKPDRDCETCKEHTERFYNDECE